MSTEHQHVSPAVAELVCRWYRERQRERGLEVPLFGVPLERDESVVDCPCVDGRALATARQLYNLGMHCWER